MRSHLLLVTSAVLAVALLALGCVAIVPATGPSYVSSEWVSPLIRLLALAPVALTGAAALALRRETHIVERRVGGPRREESPHPGTGLSLQVQPSMRHQLKTDN
jgi:hypothetical protein